MAFLRQRIRKAEDSLEFLDCNIDNYKSAVKQSFAGEIEIVPEMPSSLGSRGNLNITEVTVLSLHELEKAARLEGREFEARFGSKGMTVTETLAPRAVIIPEESRNG